MDKNAPDLDSVDSPCIGICSTLFDDECQGCGRTIVEVSNWVLMTPLEKKKVWERIIKENRALRFTRAS